MLTTSKTDPFKKGCTVLLFSTGQQACPVTALKTYLSLSPPKPASSPLFHLDNKPLTPDIYLSLLQMALVKAGYPSQLFNGHSLHEGFATSASEAKVPDHVICSIGRWNSECYKTYIHTPASVIAHAQVTVADPCTRNY